MSVFRFRIVYVVAWAVLLCCASAGKAQNAISTGAISGRATDGTGAALNSVSVVLLNQETGLKQTARTNDGGYYSFPSLPVGRYQVTFSLAGFKTLEVKNVVASVGTAAAVNAQMDLGEVSQQVTVAESSTGVLNTSDSHLSTVVERSFVENLPSLRRNYTDFVLLTPNVTTDGQFGDVTFAGSTGGPFSTYGNSNASNAFTVDGANATSRYWGSARGLTRIPYLFGAEAIQEFQVSVNPYSSAYGGSSTGFVNTVTKSGTNAFHGHAVYFNRNSGTAALDAVSKASGSLKALDVRQQFGAGLGGRIIRDKLFFFFDYEQQRRKNPTSVINPSQAAVNETNFGVPLGTALPAPTGYPVPSALTAPDATNPVYLQQVSNALSVIQRNLGIRARRQDDLVFFQKVDWQLSNSDHLTFAYNYNTFNSPGGLITYHPVPNRGQDALANNAVRDHHAVVHWIRTFSSHVVNDAHVSFARDQELTTGAGLVPAGFQPSVNLTVPSPFLVGNTANNDLREYQWSFSDRVNYQRGRHAFDIGFDFSRIGILSNSLSGYNGGYTFDSLTGFALGQWSLFSQSSGSPRIPLDFPLVAFYVGDTFKATPKLTLTLGMRYDFQVFPKPEGNPAIPLTGQYDNDYNRWAPRVGFAYHALPKTVIRGGAGFFRAFLTAQNYINATTSTGLASLRSSTTLNYNSALSPIAQAAAFPNILPANSPLFAASPNVNFIAPGFKTPSTVQASLQVEHQLTPSMTVTVGGLWVHGSHLVSSGYWDFNLIQPTGTTQYVVCPAGTAGYSCSGRTVTGPNLDSRRLRQGAIDPTVGQMRGLISPGNNNYLSGFTEFRQQMRHGLSGIVSYTFSKNIVSNGVDFNNQFDFGDTKSLSTLDQRHRIVIGAVWQPQPRFDHALAQAVLSDWTLSTSTQYGSGRPYTGLLTASCVGAASTSCVGGAVLNNSAFNMGGGIASSGPNPTLGLNTFEGPWSGGMDLSLERSFKLRESLRLMFRAQAFNALNHPNYYVQSGNSGQGVNQVQYRPGGATCGDGKTTDQVCYLIPNNSAGGFGTFQVVGQNTGPRIFQFAVMVRF